MHVGWGVLRKKAKVPCCVCSREALSPNFHRKKRSRHAQAWPRGPSAASLSLRSGVEVILRANYHEASTPPSGSAKVYQKKRIKEKKTTTNKKKRKKRKKRKTVTHLSIDSVAIHFNGSFILPSNLQQKHVCQPSLTSNQRWFV
jgi:hypothetical protein